MARNKSGRSKLVEVGMNKNRNEKGQLLKGNGRGRVGEGPLSTRNRRREEKEGRTNGSRRVSKGRA